MKILLDTHILIWVLEDNPKLSKEHKVLLSDRENEKYVSHFSFIEIAIKMKLGKLSEVDNMTILELENRVKMDGFMVLPVNIQHINAYQTIPLHEQHRDPFDRFLIATAFSERMSIMTNDEKFQLYKEIISIV
jgi:PIN domain nuclease of toxin-antitoxin system